jgi:hypothetical protein
MKNLFCIALMCIFAISFAPSASASTLDTAPDIECVMMSDIAPLQSSDVAPLEFERADASVLNAVKSIEPLSVAVESPDIYTDNLDTSAEFVSGNIDDPNYLGNATETLATLTPIDSRRPRIKSHKAKRRKARRKIARRSNKSNLGCAWAS